MRFARPPTRRNDDERILPLINIVFLLLIFFMLAGRLAADDPFDVEPARSASSAAAEADDMLVLVGADGRLALDGEVIGEAALRSAVAERLVAAEAAGTTAHIRFKADGRTEAVRVVAIMELLREAGATSLHMLTVREQP